MRKAIIFVFLLILISSAYSQFSVGYRYGIGSHGIYLEPATLKKFQVPLILSSHGIVICYNNMNNAGLQMEINYAQKGWREEIDTISGTFFERRIDYIEVPIFAHFELGKKMVRPVIIVGPYLGWKIGDSYTQNGFDDQLADEAYKQYLQEARDLDLGLKLGGGLRLNINNRFAVYGEVHYDLEIAGSRDIFKDRPDKISASRLTEVSGVFGILWHIIPQKVFEEKKGYKPKEDLYDAEY